MKEIDNAILGKALDYLLKAQNVKADETLAWLVILLVEGLRDSKEITSQYNFIKNQ